jgi:Transcriptional antiterminator
MEKLFYKLIYDKQLKRSMNILEILYKAKHDITIKELEEILGVSKKTVTNILEFVNPLLPTTVSLSIVDKTIKLCNIDNQPIDVAIVELAKKSISFQVLEHAFLDKGFNIQEVAKKLFISESTLRARIRHMNKTLRLFDCSLSFYDVKFIGHEANIRYFAYTYFSEFQELYLSVCEEQLEYSANIYAHMKKTFEDNNVKLMNYSYQQLTRLLLVTRDRLITKKYIEIKEDFIQRMNRRKSYRGFKKLYGKEIANHLGENEVPESEIVWAYIASITTIVYSDNAKRELYRDEEDIQLHKEKIVRILAKVSETFNIQKEDEKNFINIHSAYLINISLLTEISPVFQIGSTAVKKYVLSNLEYLYNVWFECLSKLDENEFLVITDIHNIVVQLTMISSQFIYKQKSQAERILYSFEGEPGFLVYLEALAKSLLPKSVEGVFIYNEAVNMQLIEILQPDIVVYNYKESEKITNCKTLRMSHIPELQEWSLLKELIINLDCK